MKKSVKACFLLQRKFAFVGHKMAKIMRDKYGVTEFCSYVYTRQSYNFLKRQTDIKYTSLLLDEEIHKSYHDEPLDIDFLRSLEAEYGIPNLWPYLMIDRIVMSNQLVREYPYDKPPYTHEEMLRILQVKAKAIINFMETEQPDFVFVIVVGGIGNMLIYQIAKKKNIKILMPINSRIGDGYLLTEDYRTFSWANGRFDKLIQTGKVSPSLKEARNFIQEFRKNPTTYLFHLKNNQPASFFIKQLAWFTPKKFFKSLVWYLKLCLATLQGKKDDFSDQRPWGFLVDRIRRKIRSLRGYNHLYDQVDFSEDYAFFPLQYQPEISTLLYAPFWTDQLSLAKQIARSLPAHFKLYIKEHPTMLGYRTQAYYKELKKIPNVKLINPMVKTFDIINKAKLVTAITSTAAWEAILLKIPTITFGDTGYNKLSMIVKCEKIEKLPYLIKNQLTNYQYNEAELETFIAALLDESENVALSEIWNQGMATEEEEKRLTLLVDLMAEKLNLHPTRN